MNPQDPEDPEMWARATRWFEGPDKNPRHMDPDLLDWVLTHHPKWIKMEVNQAAINARIKELKAQRGSRSLPSCWPRCIQVCNFTE